jgi:hypothetical protein
MASACGAVAQGRLIPAHAVDLGFPAASASVRKMGAIAGRQEKKNPASPAGSWMHAGRPLGHGWRLRLRCREHERLQRQQLLRYPVHHALERVVVGIAQDDARSLRIQATDACRRHHAGCS